MLAFVHSLYSPPLSSKTTSFYGTHTTCARPLVSRTPRTQCQGSGLVEISACQDVAKNNPEERLSHTTVEVDADMWAEAFRRAGNDVHEVARRAALGVADAFTQCYSCDDLPSVFAVIGKRLNGLIGLYTVAELQKRGYSTFIYAPDNSEHVADIPVFCQEHGVSVYDFIPTTFEFYFQVVLDCMLGTGSDGGDIWPPFWTAYEKLISTELPVVSVDVPSGWDLSLGPRMVDVTADTFIKPDVLISLGAPKLSAKRFAGAYHFIAGRDLVDKEWFAERKLHLPVYPGNDAQSVLFETNSIENHKQNGAVYGRQGQFNATLFTKNQRRRWVDIDDDMDLWDELE